MGAQLLHNFCAPSRLPVTSVIAGNPRFLAETSILRQG